MDPNENARCSLEQRDTMRLIPIHYEDTDVEDIDHVEDADIARRHRGRGTDEPSACPIIARAKRPERAGKVGSMDTASRPLE